MEPIREICLQSVKILVFILGLVGLFISFLLLLSPDLVKSLRNFFDRKIIIEKKLSFLNRSIDTERIVYKFNIPSGLLLITSAGFMLAFLFFQIDVSSIAALFRGHRYLFLFEILTGMLVLLGKIAGIAGLATGFLLLFAPHVMIRIEKKMDAWFATQFVVERLDEFHDGIDNLILRFPLPFGFAGLTTSLILIFLSATGFSR